jgi:hypothetical protein
MRQEVIARYAIIFLFFLDQVKEKPGEYYPPGSVNFFLAC